jgi:hypothetical protein
MAMCGPKGKRVLRHSSGTVKGTFKLGSQELGSGGTVANALDVFGVIPKRHTIHAMTPSPDLTHSYHYFLTAVVPSTLPCHSICIILSDSAD